MKIYTDGACAPTNPGPAGYAVVAVHDDNSITTHSECFYRSTNNRMELMAVIKAIELFAPHYPLDIFTDSMYVVYVVNSKKMKGNDPGYIQKKPNSDLLMTMFSLLKIHSNINVSWVRGHSGDTYNELADRLSYEAVKTENRKKDYGYKKNLQSRMDKGNLHL